MVILVPINGPDKSEKFIESSFECREGKRLGYMDKFSWNCVAVRAMVTIEVGFIVSWDVASWSNKGWLGRVITVSVAGQVLSNLPSGAMPTLSLLQPTFSLH